MSEDPIITGETLNHEISISVSNIIRAGKWLGMGPNEVTDLINLAKSFK